MSDRASIVRPEFGPTLPTLLAPRWRRLSRAARWTLAVFGVLVVAFVAWRIVAGAGDDRTHIVVREPITFNLFHSGGLRELPVSGDEVLRLQTPPSASTPQSFSVRAIALPAYRGDVNAYLALRAAALIQEMRRSIPGFIWRGDGRVAINRQPGHQISFQALIDGKKVYGRRVLLVEAPDPAPREALDVLLLVESSAIVPSPDFVGANGQLKSPYRTLRFGTRTSTP